MSYAERLCTANESLVAQNIAIAEANQRIATAHERIAIANESILERLDIINHTMEISHYNVFNCLNSIVSLLGGESVDPEVFVEDEMGPPVPPDYEYPDSGDDEEDTPVNGYLDKIARQIEKMVAESDDDQSKIILKQVANGMSAIIQKEMPSELIYQIEEVEDDQGTEIGE